MSSTAKHHLQFALALALGFACAGSAQDSAQANQEREPSKLAVETTRLPDAVIGTDYSFHLTAHGGQRPYTWQLLSPRLPEAFSLQETTGRIQGEPRVPDQYDFSVKVTDSSSPPQTATAHFTLAVVEPLRLFSRPLPVGLVGEPYRIQVWARGGTAPLAWRIINGALPPGLQLNPATGRMEGNPTRAQEFRFMVEVRDAGYPPQVQQLILAGKIEAPLEVTWMQLPEVRDAGIYGSVRVSNSSLDNVDLTVIILAVNEYNKAFALGYHHFVLDSKTVTRELPFGFPLPRGTYVVHVDAVAEVAPKNAIYRDRLQQGPLPVE